MKYVNLSQYLDPNSVSSYHCSECRRFDSQFANVFANHMLHDHGIVLVVDNQETADEFTVTLTLTAEQMRWIKDEMTGLAQTEGEPVTEAFVIVQLIDRAMKPMDEDELQAELDAIHDYIHKPK